MGAAIAAALAGAGHDMALHCRRAGEPDDAVRAALSAGGGQCRVVTADFAGAGAADALFDAVIAAFGRAPDLIVNNASLFAEGDVAALDDAALAAAMAVNLAAPALLTARMVVAHRGVGSQGAVVNILDQRVLNPVPDQIAYTLSKQALWQATRTLAVAGAPFVRVNAVAPGLTLPTEAYEAGRMERMAALMPLGALARPDDIAAAVLYLAGAGSVTGQTIFVDGGASLTAFARDFAFL